MITRTCHSVHILSLTTYLSWIMSSMSCASMLSCRTRTLCCGSAMSYVWVQKIMVQWVKSCSLFASTRYEFYPTFENRHNVTVYIVLSRTTMRMTLSGCRKYVYFNHKAWLKRWCASRDPGGSRIIVLYTCTTRETQKKGCFLRLNGIRVNRV